MTVLLACRPGATVPGCQGSQTDYRKGAVMTPDVYYDRHLRLWVVIFRDAEGFGIPDPVTGEEASYFGSKADALRFSRGEI